MTEIKVGTWVQVTATDPHINLWRTNDIFKVVTLERVGNYLALWGYLPPSRVTPQQRQRGAWIDSSYVKPWYPQPGEVVLVCGDAYQVLGHVDSPSIADTKKYLLWRDRKSRTVPLEDISPWVPVQHTSEDLAATPPQGAPPTPRNQYSPYSAMLTCWCGEAAYVGAGVARDTLAPVCAAGHNPYTMDTPKPEVSRRCIHGEYVWSAVGEGLRAVHPLRERAITEWETLWRTRALKRG